MKKLLSVTLCLFLLLVPFAVNAAAAPSAEIITKFSDPVTENDGSQTITMYISVSAPTEPYASMDFNLVSSSAEHLSIVDKSAAGDRSDLDITFTSDYGGAYHKGRIDEATGAISYLIGIFSTEGGNPITEETDICTVKLRYSGQVPQTVAVTDMKLVYKNEAGEIVGSPVTDDVSLIVSADLFMEKSSIPLGAFTEITSDDPLFYVLIGVGLLVVIGLVVLLVVRKRKKTAA